MSKALSIFVAAAFGVASAGALAADDAYKNARKQANDTFKADKEACKPMKGDEHKDCMKQAKAKHDQAITEAKKMHKSGGASSGTTGGRDMTPQSTSGASKEGDKSSGGASSSTAPSAASPQSSDSSTK